MASANPIISLDESALLAQLRNGESNALDRLYTQLYPALHRYACQQVDDPDLADEVLHDVFLSLWQRRERLQLDSTIAVYLFGAVRKRAITVRTTRARDSDLHQRATQDMVLTQQVLLADDQMVTHDLVDRLWTLVQTLPPNHREALTLRWQHQLDFDDIARVMQTTPAAVKKHVSRALQRLRILLGESSP